MKTYLHISFSITLIVFLSLSTSAQHQTLENTQAKYLEIERDTTFLVVSLENEAFLEQITDGGGQLVGYFKGETIFKIHETVGLSHSIHETNYYFDNSKLILVTEREDTFPYIDSLATFDYTRTETSFDGRYCFDNDKLIDKKLQGKKRVPDELTFDSITKEGQLLTMAKKYVDLIRENME